MPLVPGWVNFLCKGPGSKHFKLCGLYGLCHNYSALLLRCESSHRAHTHIAVAVP